MNRLLTGLENLVLCALLLVMVALAVWQIVARNLFGGGFLWADEFLKLLLLWLGLAGAVVASGEGKHIKIDVLSRFLPERFAAPAELVTALFTAAVCALCAWHAGRFVLMERESESILLGNPPAWIFEAAIPLAFGLIAWRYLVVAARRLRGLFAKAPPCS
ncbi:TRAP transporter small permease [Trichloromonas sp.]|uniref:TRAP transporter small permease n=1 Tax=Trichloromonas sp. TaxID=3069249 RepID=UPI002A4795A3|nr:TRAP transporter small permease [Trichloromonas sp.]